MCDRCEEHEERIRQLEAQLYGRDWEAPKEMRLTGMEEAIVATLIAADGRTCTPDLLIDATRGRRGTHTAHPTSNLIDSKICHVRAKMRPFGIEIETVWGRGWRIMPIHRERILNWRNQEAA